MLSVLFRKNKSKSKINFVIATHLFIVFALSPLVSFADLPGGIAITIEPLKDEFAPQDNLTVKISYTNVSQSDIRFLKWGTGLDGGLGPNIIDLEFEGSSLAFAGLIVKRLPPTESDFITLAANTTLTSTVNLDLSYDINRQGQYLVLPKNRASQLTRFKTVSSTFTLVSDRPIIRFKQPAAFTECTANQENQLTSALGAAESISRVARDSIAETPSGKRPSALRYKEWFGAYDLNRWNRVQANFNKIYSAAATKTVGFDCSCDDGPDPASTFAYVYANDPYNMNVCGAFWRAPLTGTDSRAGTIVHEISHFIIVANTDDHVYGQNAARSLAMSNPARAITNADNHEYFAENTPFLSMPDSVFPDLMVSSPVVSTSNPTIGEELQISGSVTNQGDGSSSVTQLSLTLMKAQSSPIVSTKAVPTLAAAANFNFQFSLEAPAEAGEYQVMLCISIVPDESNTSNNCTTLSPLVVEKRSLITPILQLLLDD